MITVDKRRINVSVIIPIYIDERSTDDSAIILAWYKKYPDKSSVFRTKGQGVWWVREVGIEKACGMYVGFVECDGQIKSDMYDKIYIYSIWNVVIGVFVKPNMWAE